MTEDEKKEAVEAEVVEETEVKAEEKKEGAFKKFWNKTKKAVGDAVLENNIESSFKKANQEFTLYQKDEAFSKALYGFFEEETITVWGKVECKPYSIVIDTKTEDAYYVLEIAEATCKSIVDGVEYERPATKLTLTKDVTEVKVVKAGKRYYLYKGE